MLSRTSFGNLQVTIMLFVFQDVDAIYASQNSWEFNVNDFDHFDVR